MPGSALRDRDAFHRMGSSSGALAGAFRGALPRLAGREHLPRVFTGVRRHRLDLSSRRFRGANRGRARPCDFCRWMSPRARLRTTRTSRSAETAVGTTAMLESKVAFLFEAAAGVLQGQGPGHPMPGIPGRDCSRRRLRPNPDRPGHLLSRDVAPRRSGATRRGSSAAGAGRPCKERPAAGRRGTGHPRRGPVLTSPRCLPSPGRSQASGPVSVSRSRETGAGAFFTIVETRGKTPAIAPDGSMVRPREMANHPPSTRRSAPV
jgi:hypothetical protein